LPKRLQVLPCLFICLSLIVFSAYRVSAVSTTMAVDPSLSVANVGDTITVNVTVTNIANFTSWQLNLYYLNTVLNCTGAVEGPFLKTGGGTFFGKTIANNYNSTYGSILAYSTLLGITTVNGSGVILTVTFKAIGGGNTALTLANTQLGDEKIPPQSIPHVDVSGAVNVAGASPDIAVTNVTPSKTVVGRNFAVNFTVTLANLGGYAETFNTTLYANLTALGAPFSTTLLVGSSANFTVTWNTTGYAYGNYTVTAYAVPVSGDVNPANNNFTISPIAVTIIGDINGDFKVSLIDLVFLANAYGTTPASGGIPGVAHAWNPNADIDGNNVVGLTDLVYLALHYGQHYP